MREVSHVGSYRVGGRPGREHPKGWTYKRGHPLVNPVAEANSLTYRVGRPLKKIPLSARLSAMRRSLFNVKRNRQKRR